MTPNTDDADDDTADDPDASKNYAAYTKSIHLLLSNLNLNLNRNRNRNRKIAPTQKNNKIT